MTETEKKNDKKIKSKKSSLKIILLLISYVVVAVIVWRVAVNQQLDPVKQQEQAQKEVQATTQKVDKLIVLPQEETPQIAIIQDVATLKKTQEFFVDAADGDKILVYLKARKAIIYRESTNKIINVGPVGEETSSKPASTPVAPTTPETTASSTDSE